MRIWLNTLGAFSVIGALTTTVLAGDSEKGAKVYAKCKACHMVGPKAKRRTGPVLNNILNAKAGHALDFKYSDALLAAGQDGLHWSEENLDAFLKNPKDFLPKTRMSFRGLASADDRADVIAYLTSFSGGQMAQKVDAQFSLAPEILAIEGDVEYGEYLASECTTCHQRDGDNDGIPAIVGWDTEPFVVAMHAYREGQRDHEVMNMVSGRLSDEEIAALAAYFKDLVD